MDSVPRPGHSESGQRSTENLLMEQGVVGLNFVAAVDAAVAVVGKVEGTVDKAIY